MCLHWIQFLARGRTLFRSQQMYLKVFSVNAAAKSVECPDCWKDSSAGIRFFSARLKACPYRRTYLEAKQSESVVESSHSPRIITAFYDQKKLSKYCSFKYSSKSVCIQYEAANSWKWYGMMIWYEETVHHVSKERLSIVLLHHHHHHHHNSLIQVDRRNSVQNRVRIQYIIQSQIGLE